MSYYLLHITIAMTNWNISVINIKTKESRRRHGLYVKIKELDVNIVQMKTMEKCIDCQKNILKY